jgi:hypothetical protein
MARLYELWTLGSGLLVAGICLFVTAPLSLDNLEGTLKLRYLREDPSSHNGDVDT